MAVPVYLHIVQYCAFVIAIVSNCLLLHLIRMRAGASFGRYRVLMISFSIYAIVYANIEIFTLPVMYIQGSGMIFYVDSFLKYHQNAGLLIASRPQLPNFFPNQNFSCLLRMPSSLYLHAFDSLHFQIYCCLQVPHSQLSFVIIQFSRQQNIQIFNGNKIYFLFLPPFTLFIIWAIEMYTCYRPEEIKRDFFRKIITDLYEEDIDQIAFIAPLYYTRQKDGSVLYRIPDLIGCLMSCGIMGTCFTTCIVCAYKTYNKLHDVSIRMSKRTRSLSKQLFWSLGLQTLLPCVTQYIPVGLVFVLPLFEIEVGKYINFVGVTCSLYPALDPLIAIFIIDRFRNYLLRREKASEGKISQISTYKSQRDSSLA
ncbi:Protein CBG26876 [Caenorhabditis briggsae]|uniref:Protein CBG26876 n=1 Tax=Caenorhabditis briggsae TaxID=6238 RepID=B6II76_CAEBR|nr:Protein CBG26876 [Caenorhabditis briggsae]CAR99606.1 Protein CBG26876 [Caenorhabditis briggsae]